MTEVQAPVPTRIVRVDAHNVAVEYLREVEVTEKDESGKRLKTGQKRQEWTEEAYYGHRLDMAAKTALFNALPIGEPVTPELVRAAVEEIVARTKEFVGK